jgi:hypothetical protein
MLCDPRWNAETDPCSLDSLITWLENKPSGTQYNFYDRKGRCLLSQYLADAMPKTYWATAYIRLTRLAPITETLARQTPWTFGAALERARALQAGLA